MSLLWSLAATTDAHGDVVMEDAPSWNATSAVYRAGRELSGWLFRPSISPPLSPKGFFEHSRFHYPPIDTHVFDRPRVMTSPIQGLPHEILGEIFREYVHGTTPEFHSSNQLLKGSYKRIRAHEGMATTPIHLGHVCSSWRAITFSTSFLWSKLYAIRPKRRDIPLFLFWLSRSAPCPLDLSIIQRPRLSTEVDTDTQHFLAAAVLHCTRWRRINLRLDQAMEPFLISASQNMIVSSLAGFQLHLSGWSAEGNQCISQLLSTSRHLRSVGWINACENIGAFLGTPWTTLSSITLGYIDLSDLHTILPHMQSVQNLSIGTLTAQSPNSSPSHDIQPTQTLHHLRTLSVDRCADLSPLLDVLVLPTLSEIALADGFGYMLSAESGWASFAGLVERSGCCVRSLSWSDRNANELDRVLHFNQASRNTLSELCHLALRCPVKDLIGALGLGQEHELFPKLQSLELRDCWATGESLQRMALSRPDLKQLRVCMQVCHEPLDRLESQRPGLLVEC